MLVLFWLRTREPQLVMGITASKTSENFPHECIDDIFRHLSEDELLKCTLVSPSWNNYIGSSRWFMEYILITCSADAKINDLNNMLSNSNRKYSCLEVGGDYSEKCRELSRQRSWTHFSCNLRFKKVTDFFEFLRFIQTSIRNLALNGEIIERHYHCKPDVESFNLQFP